MTSTQVVINPGSKHLSTIQMCIPNNNYYYKHLLGICYGPRVILSYVGVYLTCFSQNLKTQAPFMFQLCVHAKSLCNPMKPTRLLCPWRFFRQEYWSGLSFPSPGHLPDSGIEPTSLTSPALAGRFFTH